MELAQAKDFSATLIQEDFTKNMKPLPRAPGLRAGRKESWASDETKLRQRKSGALRRAAMVSRPGIRSRPARCTSGINALCGRGAYRVDELVHVAKEWQNATVV